MAEALVSSILGQLAAFTLENGGKELQLVTGVEKGVEKLQRNFEAIHDVLEDAEEKQIMERNVKRWLNKLEDVSYNMEDVLDEWNTVLSKLRRDVVQSASIPKKMVSPFVSCFSFGRRVVRRYDIGIKIKGINEELDEIAREKDRYRFARREIREPRRLEETTCFIDVSEVKGRDDVRDKLIRQLTFMTGDDGCISIISIVGMGGIGKTALAQMVFNEIRHQKSFDKTVWVCVSDFFHQTKVAREILEGLGSDLSGSQNQISLQSLLNEIFERTKDMKLFLVFDDVWTERDEDWRALKAALQHCKRGSRILVTTRKESVAKVMRSSHVFSLELLSDEVCWDIIKQVVWFGREEGECGDLEDVGKGIAKKM
ncbi:hypothetical protein V6N13_015948 [Hibiscus sabdariffa]|uniref:Uncharacterized protein n=1 Tax=Hibiscus sabdariffa TaxID=183260 RepID=A0ABR2CZW2_9ROSI